MKNRTMLYAALTLLLAATLWSCGPSYVGVRTGPPYGPAYGYYGARPYYGYRPRVYVAPPPRAYYRRPYYSYRYNTPRYGNGGRRGWR